MSDITVDIKKNEITVDFAKTVVEYTGYHDFVSLTDTPDSYTGQAQKVVAVKNDESGLEFVESPVSTDWGEIEGTLSNQTDLQDALDAKVDENTAITGATKTKITYDSKGLVTSGADATTDDISEGTTNLYDKVVSFTGGTNVQIGGTYPSFSLTDNSINSTDLSTALLDYVPYSGATGSVDLGSYNLTATNVIETTPTLLKLNQSTPQTLTASPYISSLTAGRVLFVGANKELTDDSNFLWNNTNKRLGIGTTPVRALHVRATSTQLRLAYDGTYYLDIGVGSSGSVDFMPVSGSTYFDTTAKDNTLLVYDYTTDTSTYASIKALTLDLRDSGTSVIRLNANPNQDSYINNGGNFIVGQTSGQGFQVLASKHLQVGTAFTYTPNVGDFAVGNPSANARFFLGQNNNYYGGMQWNYNATGASAYLSIFTSYAGENILISPSGTGKVGIKKTPVYGLDVYGTATTDEIRSNIGFDIYPVPDPTTLSGVVSSGGSVDDGVHYYAVTFTTALGETHPYYTAAITTTTGNNTVTLTLPVSTDPRVTGRKIYRTKAGRAQYEEYLLTTINDNTTTTYVDTAADSTLTGSSGVAYFRTNTTTNGITVSGSKVFTLDSQGIFIGQFAGQSITTGGRNFFAGYNSGAAVTSGGSHTFVGFASGSQTTTSSFCNAFGTYSLNGNTTGAYNSGFGNNTLMFNQVGQHNSAFGTFALQGVSGSSFSYNSALGSYAGAGITTGSNNTFIGYRAGTYIADGSTVNANGGSSVFLGGETKANADNETNEIVIGYNVTGAGSNKAVIGNSSMTNIYFGSSSASATVNAGKFKLSALNTAPSSASDTGTTGEIRVTSSAIYVCIANNTWVKADLATW